MKNNAQGSFVIGVLSTASAAYCSAFWQTIHTVFTSTVSTVDCTYRHQPLTTLYLHAKFQLQILCTS